MAKLTIPAKVWSKPVQEYKDRFGHGPSAEACKFRTDAEISAMAEEALKANTAIDDWKFRPFRKYGTGLDELYHSDPPNHHEKSSSGEFAPLSKKEARKQAIEATIKSNKLAKKKRAIEKTSSERVETTRKSDSKNLTAPTSAENKIYIDSVRARSVASHSTRFDINNNKASLLKWATTKTDIPDPSNHISSLTTPSADLTKTQEDPEPLYSGEKDSNPLHSDTESSWIDGWIDVFFNPIGFYFFVVILCVLVSDFWVGIGVTTYLAGFYFFRDKGFYLWYMFGLIPIMFLVSAIQTQFFN